MTAHVNELAVDVRGLRRRYGGVTAWTGSTSASGAVRCSAW
ncbi:hypothetical protein [Streptomyces sp. NPDC046759]